MMSIKNYEKWLWWRGPQSSGKASKWWKLRRQMRVWVIHHFLPALRNLLKCLGSIFFDQSIFEIRVYRRVESATPNETIVVNCHWKRKTHKDVAKKHTSKPCENIHHSLLNILPSRRSQCVWTESMSREAASTRCARAGKDVRNKEQLSNNMLAKWRVRTWQLTIASRLLCVYWEISFFLWRQVLTPSPRCGGSRLWHNQFD